MRWRDSASWIVRTLGLTPLAHPSVLNVNARSIHVFKPQAGQVGPFNSSIKASNVGCSSSVAPPQSTLPSSCYHYSLPLSPPHSFMRTFSLLTILTVISGTLFTSAAPLDLAVDVAAKVDASIRRGLAANRVSGVRETLESFHDRDDTTSSAKRDAIYEAAVHARSVSVLALTKRFGNLVRADSAPTEIHTIGKRQPQPIADLNVQTRAQAQVGAAANVDLLLKRDPAAVVKRQETVVRAGLGTLFGGLKRDLATILKRRDVSDDH
ncbi:hypothetical protein JOM56_009782 [Amanita muscaria]